ncbi:MAG: hypothetical protein PHP82_01830 [Candidatus ainarchaeum sp.]|nr:hypothetical protein [Candidatus ainarchaeum sp.]
MPTMTLSVPTELKQKMDKTDWINWSSVARKAFAETLIDLQRMNTMKKIEEISEIVFEDNREIKDELFKKIINKTEKVSKEIAIGKRKTMTPSDFKQMCDKL